MRVLERRTPLAESGTTVPAPRSYAVSPARPSRAEVVVQHSQPSAPERLPHRCGRAGATRLVGGMSARRLRGLSLLASLTLLVVVAPLAVFGVLAGWTALLAVAVLALDLAWLRRAAQVERARRRTATRAARREPSLTRTHAGRPPSLPARTARRARGRRRSPRRRGHRGRDAGVGPDAGDADPAPAAQVDTVSGSGWQPVPVPPPTYTLKAKASGRCRSRRRWPSRFCGRGAGLRRGDGRPARPPPRRRRLSRPARTGPPAWPAPTGPCRRWHRAAGRRPEPGGPGRHGLARPRLGLGAWRT